MWPFFSGRRRGHRLGMADSFRRRLETDRLRADRMGISLTLVAIRWDPTGTWDGRPDESAVRAEVLDLVEERLRATDETGGLEEDELGVVLWDTDAGGAEVFVSRLIEAAPERLGITATAYVYPDRRDLTRGDDKAFAADNRTDEGPPAGPDDPSGPAPLDDVETMALSSPTVLQETVPTETALAPAESAATGVGGSASLAIEALQPQLVRPLSPLRRAIDVVGAGFGLLAASPFLVAAAVAIKLDDGGPVFFKQRRAGLGGRGFDIWKLRTMGLDAEARKAALKAQSEQDGAAFKMTHDPRVTRVGGFLRKTSIDELPQLWNVLRGEMSLVGPRPLPLDEQAGVDRWQHRRLDVMPGLTCIWQVEGRSRVSFAEWMRMDMRYIAGSGRRDGLWQDIKLIVGTVPAVLLRRGAK